MLILRLCLVTAIVSATFRCVNIFGEFQCNTDIVKRGSVKIAIYDKDYDSDDLMGLGYSQYDGTFAIYGCGSDYDFMFWENSPDPFLSITHTCNSLVEHIYTYEFTAVFAPQKLDMGIIMLDDGKPLTKEKYLMQEEAAEDLNEVVINFDDLEFGLQNNVVPYGGAASVASQIPLSPTVAALICGVLKKCCVGYQDFTFSPLPRHSIGIDHLHRIVFMRAEVHFDNLNKGADLTAKSCAAFKHDGLPGDIPAQFIPKQIGGFDSPVNYFPLNPDVDLSSWHDAISKVYKHVNGGAEYVARLLFVINYAYEDPQFLTERPLKISFNFKLYKNNVVVGEVIEGHINNFIPEKSQSTVSSGTKE